MKLRSLNDTMIPLAPKTLTEWEAEKKKIIDNLKFASSVELLKHDAPLNPLIFDTVEFEHFAVEKVIFQSLPGFYVTGNLYRPKDISKKYPAVLNPHGHWDKGRLETEAAARIPQRCANLAMRGMVAFIYDMIGWNDSRQLKHECFDPEWEKWNFSCFSLQLNNSLKAVDFVASLPYVDSDRIGCTGCSGGGTQTYFLAAIDSRIKAAAPINMASVHMQGGCRCENAAFLRTDYCNIDYTAAIAPRPLFMSASDGDWTFESQTAEFPAVEHIYGLYNASDKFEHFYQHADHCYNLPTRERVYGFFCRSFGLENPFPGEVDFEIHTDKLLIGDIRSFVPREGFIENQNQLFEVVRQIMTENLAARTDAQRERCNRMVCRTDRTAELEIPYAVEDETGSPQVIRLGRCPDPTDMSMILFPHCYNLPDDNRHVSGLVALFRRYPDCIFRAAGKTAALCKIAAQFAPGIRLELSQVDASHINMAGSALIG